MHHERRFLGNLLSAALWASFLVPQASAAPPTVTATPMVTNPVVVFDPSKAAGTPAGPPNNLPGPPVDAKKMPTVPAGADAVTSCDARGTAGPNGVTVTGVVTIYVPVLPANPTAEETQVDQELRAHEQGHVDLCKNEYAKNAQKKFSEAISDLTGTTLQKALDRGREAFLDQEKILSDKFDRLTKDGTSNTVTASQGVSMALAERDAPPPGEAPGKPDTSKQWGFTAPDPARVFFDPLTNRLSLGGDVLITDTANPLDPIRGRGAFEFDPMLVIGPAANGSIHLADTAFRIRDTFTGDLLLNGYLLEIGYLPSTLPGFAGMLQGFLDIPPLFAGGISNTIASQLLDAFAAGSLAGDAPAVWFFADQPLFDPGGHSQTGLPFEITGNLKGGFSDYRFVPEPASVWLLLAGFMAWATRLKGAWRRPRQFGRSLSGS